MKIYTYEGKNIEELKEKAFTELSIKEEDILIKVYEEESGGLFKSKKSKIDVIIKEDIVKYLKETLLDIIAKMGIKVNIEAKIRGDNIKFTLFSDNNAILIGKGGRTVDSLQTIIRHILFNKIKININITLDVENYKEKQNHRIEMMANRLAREVLSTGADIKMDSMNSYERRIVHEAISKIDGVHTISEGEEPNRYVVIKID